MTIPRPNRDQVRAVARDLRISLSDSDAQSYIGLMEASLTTYEALEAMPDELPPVKYPRTPGREPAAHENPFNAWSVVTEIAGAPTGKLAGKRVAIKDNVCVAGVQMMNGASVLKGYMPEVDATIVSRILDAGATIVGKARCEYFCASGASFTSAGAARCSIRTGRPIRRAARLREAPSPSRPGPPTSRSAAIRAARSGFPRPVVAWSV